jgi:hypothetical protein
VSDPGRRSAHDQGPVDVDRRADPHPPGHRVLQGDLPQAGPRIAAPGQLTRARSREGRTEGL